MTQAEIIFAILGSLQVLIMIYFMVRLKAIETSTHQTVILLTVIANRQGATQEDVEKALSK